MARGTTLATLRQMVRAETGQTLVSGVATQGDATINQVLANKQKWLSSEYDWPFLEDKWDKVVTPGNRYLPFPTINSRAATTTINFERPVLVEVFYNNAWQDVVYGIGSEEMNCRNSDQGEVQDPIQRWDFSTNVDEPAHANEFEIWPLVTTQQTVRFTGQRQPLALVADGDRADLDDMLLIYMVSAEMLQRLDQEDARIKLTLAQERLRQLRAVYPHRDQDVVLGRNHFMKSRSLRRVVPMVIVK